MQRFALTAHHCVSGIEEDDPVDLVGSSGWTGTATVIAKRKTHDLALLEATLPPDVTVLPVESARSVPGEDWLGPCRPSDMDPHLEGQVTEEIDYECTSGGKVRAIQLLVRTELGDYSGYSGGPVHRKSSDPPAVLGLLFEQYPDREASSRASNVLFAAPIDEAWRLFRELALAREVDRLSSMVAKLTGQPPPAPKADIASRTSEGIKASQDIIGFLAESQLEPRDYDAMKIRVADNLIRYAFNAER
jgi:S1-C subfamily serine protease